MVENQTENFDVIVVGSGPSGVHASDKLVSSGLRVALIDIGFTDDEYEAVIPHKTFSAIRESDIEQQLYFLGKNPSELLKRKRRAGTHLTPARYHMLLGMEELFPTVSKDFFCLQSSACGGLGAGWGANCFQFDNNELTRIGLPAQDIHRLYQEVIAEIGISGATKSDIAALIGNFNSTDPPLRLDTNAQRILKKYQIKREWLNSRNFFLGQSLMAILSKPRAGRNANPYFDMDFWADIGRSVYRPRFTLEKLQNKSNFSYLSRQKALSFRCLNTTSSVSLKCLNLKTNCIETITAKRLILALGAINTARIALCSTQAYDKKLPILCNPNYWLAAINWNQLGRPWDDERYSLAQLTALMKARSSPINSDDEWFTAQLYSYRSLLLFKLMHDIPLPPPLSLLYFRLIQTSLCCINVHFADQSSANRWLSLRKGTESDHLEIKATFDRNEIKHREQDLRRLVRCFMSLGCFTLRITRPLHGASIHYAGTLPFSDKNAPLTCDDKCRLRGFNAVYVADSSSWKYLPAKGLTLTVMANARHVAENVVRDLRGSSAQTLSAA